MEEITVLLVDDYTDFADIASTLLEAESDAISVVTETSPQSALDRLTAGDIDCIVSDFLMAEMDGIEFLETVREDFPDLPFVMFTGKGDEEVAGEAISSGVSDYMRKEGSVDQYAVLANRIVNAVSRRRAEAQVQRQTRINDLIRDVVRALVNETTREGIEREVCERLVTCEPYEFAWIGEADRRTGGITLRASAGEPADALEGSLVAADGGTAVDRPEVFAANSGEVQVVNDIDDAAGAPWHEEAARRGYHSAIALPLTYAGVPYGVMGVYAARPNVFDDTERDILTELSDVIAYVINASESRRELFADGVVELEFRLGDESVFPVHLSAELEGEIQFESALPRPDGSIAAVYTIEEATVESVEEVVEDTPGVERLELLFEDGQTSRWTVVTDGTSIASTLAEYGLRTRSIVAEAGAAHVIAEAPREGDVGRAIEAVQTTYDQVDLVARRELTRPPQGEPLESSIVEELTDRQREVAETAYLSGFFEWPREHDGDEIADMLGISQPTFSQHIRTVERKLFDRLFGD